MGAESTRIRVGDLDITISRQVSGRISIAVQSTSYGPNPNNAGLNQTDLGTLIGSLRLFQDRAVLLKEERELEQQEL